ncbi:uncharacterized protein Bfra_009950 [Botrytis fragariae]|uniref:Uncharacterized protein n=1 Tax=Botrytis fragariae TaxID=1964551 RepID=A0A8H6ANC8_9HELO|nr:uncharacterized protein Bfra_009950 [Botrytis fragariae]KAF5870561.1 hypothetical protein Bfra_009950 [Botrytis fragariae]
MAKVSTGSIQGKEADCLHLLDIYRNSLTTHNRHQTHTGDNDSNHAAVWLPDLEIEACVTIMLVITKYMTGKCCPRREGAMHLAPRYSAPSGKPLFQHTYPPSYIHSFLRRLFRKY